MQEIEIGARIKVKTVDDEGFIVGKFVGTEETLGSDFLILDVGDPEPMQINVGFILWVQCLPPGELKSFPKKRNLRVTDK